MKKAVRIFFNSPEKIEAHKTLPPSPQVPTKSFQIGVSNAPNQQHSILSKLQKRRTQIPSQQPVIFSSGVNTQQQKSSSSPFGVIQPTQQHLQPTSFVLAPNAGVSLHQTASGCNLHQPSGFGSSQPGPFSFGGQTSTFGWQPNSTIASPYPISQSQALSFGWHPSPVLAPAPTFIHRIPNNVSKSSGRNPPPRSNSTLSAMEGVIKYVAPDTFAISGSMSVLTVPMKGLLMQRNHAPFAYTAWQRYFSSATNRVQSCIPKHCLQMALQNGGRKCPSCLAGIGEPQGKYCSF